MENFNIVIYGIMCNQMCVYKFLKTHCDYALHLRLDSFSCFTKLDVLNKHDFLILSFTHVQINLILRNIHSTEMECENPQSIIRRSIYLHFVPHIGIFGYERYASSRASASEFWNATQ